MLDGHSAREKRKSRIVLFSADAHFVQAARSVFNTNAAVGFSIVESGLDGLSAERVIRDAAVVIVDLGTPEQKQRGLSDLQDLIGRAGGDLPVIVVVDSFDEVVGRTLVQMRVADILVKPVEPTELLRACARVMRTGSEQSQIYTFLPVTGGAGTTTIAIQSALTLLDNKNQKSPSTCLVDLNFHRSACVDYLDIEARLNLKEIEISPERLDRQLLEGMLSYHPSGLAVIAAPNLPTELLSVTPNIVMGMLNVVCQCFEQIVIDMPNAWHSWTENVVLGSNKLFLVSEATVPSLRKAKQLAQTISAKFGQRPKPNVIVNRFQWQLFGSGLRRADLKSALGDAFACTIPYNHRLVREAIDRGVPLNDVRKNSDVAVAIKQFITPRRVKISAPLQSPNRSPTLNWAWPGRA